jgi:hypothetical protein
MAGYLDLFRARRRSGRNTPTLTPQSWRKEQKKWAAEGLCVECGESGAQEKSLLCVKCQRSQSFDDILDEIRQARRQVLNTPQNEK